jgi:hypothetical protein
MHKERELEAYTVWRKIRGFQKLEDKQEFFLMRHLVEQEEEEEKGKHAYAWYVLHCATLHYTTHIYMYIYIDGHS